MSNDRELLELAAKAAGIAGKVSSFAGMDIRYGFDFAIYNTDTEDYWNPLADDGDALRLAVELDLLIMPYPLDMAIRVTRLDQPDTIEQYTGDQFAATRRAIVRAASEIGREMP